MRKVTITMSDEEYEKQQLDKAEGGHLPWAHVAQHDAYGKGYKDGLGEAVRAAQALEREKARYTQAIEMLLATTTYVLKIPDPRESTTKEEKHA